MPPSWKQRVMRDDDVGLVPIVDGDRLRDGDRSRHRDPGRRRRRDPSSTTVREIASTDLVTIDPEQDSTRPSG